MPDTGMHRLHICCAMRANGSFVIRGKAEFFGCGMRKSEAMGNLRNAKVRKGILRNDVRNAL